MAKPKVKTDTAATEKSTFEAKNLSVLAYANNFTLWHYKSETDGLGKITGMGYFNPAKDMIRHGDAIIINASDNLGTQVFASVDGEGNIRI